jgi:Microcystin-dependent protein
MKRTLGNFLTQANQDFPLDCETFSYLQDNLALMAVLGNVAGNKVILSGCELEQSNTQRKAGYVFLKTADYPNGEVIYWEGGRISSGMYVKVESISVQAQGFEYSHAYSVRSLAAGIGTENYSWNDFKDIQTLLQLKDYQATQDAKIAALSPPPVGIIQMWGGATTPSALPENYALCDGTALSISAYPELYQAIGKLHTPTGTASDKFCLPDLRARFVVGFTSADADYNTIAKKGGAKTVALASTEMPPHVHSFKDYYFVENPTTGRALTGVDVLGSNHYGSAKSDSDNKSFYYYTHNTNSTGGSSTVTTKAHENRPPYYTLAYIMRVK